MTYSEKLKDPRWQKKRLQIFNRDKWKCRSCLNEKLTLNIHHMSYSNKLEPWEYPSLNLVTVCNDCHEKLHSNNEETKTVIFLKLWFWLYMFNELKLKKAKKNG